MEGRGSGAGGSDAGGARRSGDTRTFSTFTTKQIDGLLIIFTQNDIGQGNNVSNKVFSVSEAVHYDTRVVASYKQIGRFYSKPEPQARGLMVTG